MYTADIDLFKYENPRAYLKKVFDENHRANPRYYTYNTFAEILGLTSKGFVYNYLYPKGKHGNKTSERKKLSDLHCTAISQALKHSREETLYLHHLVHADQSPDAKEQEFHLNEAAKIRASSKITMTNCDQIEYYSHWHHSAIRSLIDMYPIKDNYPQICQMLNPPVTPAQAKKSIQLLNKLGFITMGEDGFYHCVKKIINTSGEIPQNIKNNAHIGFIDLAKEAIRDLEPKSRYAVSHTIGVSGETYEAITREIESFRSTLRTLIDKDKNPRRVYQLEILLFPISSDNLNN